MSIVCCKVYEDRIEIASDSIAVRGWTQHKDKERKHSKLFQVNDLTIGTVGTCAESSLLTSFCLTNQPESPSEVRITDFVRSFAEWKKKITDKFDIENDYILIFKGKVFLIESFFITEILTHDAIGAGMDFALAALFLGHDVEKAVDVSCELSTMCEKPIKKIVVKK